jgi:integrase
MAVLAECPICHRKQATKNKVCKCDEDLDKAKRSKKVRYWIAYRLPGSKKLCREYVSKSIEEARDADGKRRGQKRENRIFDIKPEAKMTFQQLTEWYLKLEKVRAMKSCWRIQIALQNFNSEYGTMMVRQIKLVDLEDYQVKRKAQGASDGTIDKELTMVQTMVNKAFYNDLVSGDTLKTFKRLKRLLTGKRNARDRILSLDEFHALMDHLPFHSKNIVATAFYTGMRRGEILNLTWDKVGLRNRVIRLEAEDTKDSEARTIPITDDLYEILRTIPRSIHDNHVFLHKGKPISDIRTALRKGCKEAGIPYGHCEKNGFVFHDLRHSYNTHMRKAGVPESVIMKITGHSTRQMFDRYNTVDTEDARQAVGKLQGYFQSVHQNVHQEAK